MNKGLTFVYGLILGAAAGLLFAPHSGRRTRSLVKDKATKYSHEVAHYGSGKGRHLTNKAKGYAHSIKGAFSRSHSEEGELQAYI